MAGLSIEEQQRYQEQGYVIPQYRLPPGKLAELRDAVDWVIENNPQARPEHLVSIHVVNNQPERIKGHKSFLDLTADPAILDLVEDAIGRDIILWGAHLFCKPVLTGMEVPMHQDGEYWPIRPLATCSVWIALDDVTRENGCMRFIPGSHKSQTPYAHERQDRDDVVINMEIDKATYDVASAVDIELEAGQMSLHDIYLIHGSNANRSNNRRAGLALRYMPASSHFIRDMFPPSEKTGLRIDFAERPLLLQRGRDVSGKNDLKTGRQWLN